MNKQELIVKLSKAIAKKMGCENETDTTFWKCREKEAEACYDIFISQGIRSGQANEIIDSLERLSFYVGDEECYMVPLQIAKCVVQEAIYNTSSER